MNKAELIKFYMDIGMTEEEATHIVNAMETELDEEESEGISDKVKLIVEIPRAMYEHIQNGTYCGALYKELKNGIPLDTLKAEIKEKCDNINNVISNLPYPKHRLVQGVLCEILASIDNVEREDKE